VSEELRKFPQLKEADRIAAKVQARANLIIRLGGEPRLESLAYWSRFGTAWELVTLLALCVVFLAAFVVSAAHIYSTIDQNSWVIRVAFVLLAESSVLALSLAPTVWQTPKAVTVSMYLGVMGAAFIAAVGNINAAILYTSGPFNWIIEWWSALATAPDNWAIATIPPLMTVLVGQGLKYYALSRSAARHEAKLRYDQDMARWKDVIDHLEEHPDWQNVYAWALWDAWRKGKNRDMVAEITQEERWAIVQREIDADEFFGKQQRSTRRPVPQKRGTAPEHAERAEQRTGPSSAERVKQHLIEHPEHVNMPRRELAELLNVSLGTTQRGVDKYMNNGHSQERP
jgi:hypothetical protein